MIIKVVLLLVGGIICGGSLWGCVDVDTGWGMRVVWADSPDIGSKWPQFGVCHSSEWGQNVWD